MQYTSVALQEGHLDHAQLRGAVRHRQDDPDAAADTRCFRRKCRQFWKSAAKIGGKSDRNKMAILAFVSEHDSVKTSEVAESLHLGQPRTRELLRELVDEGSIVPEGESRARRYRISDEPGGNEE